MKPSRNVEARGSRAWPRRMLAALALWAIAGCGLEPGAPIGQAVSGSATSGALGAGLATSKAFLTPDYQETLTFDAHGKPTGSWYDVHAQAGDPAGANQDAREIAALAGASSAGFADYMATHAGPVALYVGGLGDEHDAWNPPFISDPGVPSLALNYALNAHTILGARREIWWPWGHQWQQALLPYDGVPGLPRYEDDVRYGATLVDRLIKKLESAGAREIWLFGHSKGADVASQGVYNPYWRIDHRHDERLTRVWTFAMPMIAPHTPKALGFHSHAPHWGGFFKGWDGKLVIYNRDSDFVTYGGWLNLASHDYGNLVRDCAFAPFHGARGHSPLWSPTENFMSRLARFASGPERCDQSAAALSYDW